VCTQESALYGDLVLFLRDRAAELLAGDGGGVEVEQERLDSIVRDWFFTPQDGLHGCAPRDLIWAEQKGEPNPIHPDRLDEFFEDDCPEPTLFGPRYRRLTYDEALSLAVGLHEQGVDVETLLAQIEAFPYQNVALDWLSQPEENVAVTIQALEQVIAPDDEEEVARFRHHRDFILTLARVVRPCARLWLQGWLDAVAHGAFARPGGQEVDDVF
jgi:hypothetical protein